jgi:hypothetical protein
MRRAFASALAFALVVPLAVPSGLAAATLDQAAESPGDLYRFQWSGGSANANGLAQTLTVGQTGVLEALELFISREDFTTQDLIIQIRDGSPDGPALAISAPVPAASIPVHPASGWVRFTFTALTYVTAGQTVAIVTPLPDPSWADSDPAWFWAWSGEDYPSGLGWDGYWANRWTDPVETWASWWDGSDRTFRTYVAAEALNVSFFGCAYGDGTTTVPAGAYINIRAGWGAKTLGQIVTFLTSVTTDATLDGYPINGSFGSPAGSKADGWGVFWNYPTVAPAAGESITVTLEWTLRHPVFDGFALYPAGSVDEGLTCTIAGESA